MDLILTLFCISLLLLLTGVFFRKMEDIFLTEPLLAMAAGILLGPDVLNIIKSGGANIEFEVLKTTCEFTIAMALMATALRLPRKFFRSNPKTQSYIVILGMILMWLFTSAIVYFIFPGFSLAKCMLLGAIVTPTDPVVASTIVTGVKAKKFLPPSVRNTLSFEAGANDGLAYPIVLFSLFLFDPIDLPFSKWFLHVLLYETILCGILAFFIGLGAGKVMHKAHKAGYMNQKSLLSYSIALAFFLLAGFQLFHMNGIIAVFIGGLGFAQVISNNEDLEEKNVQESMERIFTIPVYFIFGMMLPWYEWFAMGWTAIILIVLVFLFRRLPAFFAISPLLPRKKGKKYDILIMGWFGPIGVAALYYAIHVKEKIFQDEVWVIPSLIVFASTILHGVSSVPFERMYHRIKKNRIGEENMEINKE